MKYNENPLMMPMESMLLTPLNSNEKKVPGKRGIIKQKAMKPVKHLEAKEGAGKVLEFSARICLTGFASAITHTLWSVAKLPVQTSLQLTYSLKGLLNINKAVDAGVQHC
jgi:hypothetical protein